MNYFRANEPTSQRANEPTSQRANEFKLPSFLKIPRTLLAALCLLFLFTSCEKEELNTVEHQDLYEQGQPNSYQVKKIPFNKIEDISQLKEHLQLAPKITNTNKGSSSPVYVPLSGTNFLINTEYVTLIEKDGESMSYTMVLKDPTDPSRFLNLATSPDGELMVIFEYDFTEKEKMDLSQNIGISIADKYSMLGYKISELDKGNPGVIAQGEVGPCAYVIHEPIVQEGHQMVRSYIVKIEGCKDSDPGSGSGSDSGSWNWGDHNPGDYASGGPGGSDGGGNHNPGHSGGSDASESGSDNGLPSLPTYVDFEVFYNTLIDEGYSDLVPLIKNLDYELQLKILSYYDSDNFNMEFLKEALEALGDGGDVEFAKKFFQLMVNIENNPNYLLEHYSLGSGDGDYSAWAELAQYIFPQQVIDKIAYLKQHNNEDWDLQLIENATGANVNMDYFPVKITQLPNKPIYLDPNQSQFTAEEFLNYVRRNINLFTKDDNGDPLSTFSPSTDTGPNYNESVTWNSADPLTAILHIDIPLGGPFTNDGSVICSKYNSDEWYFTTLTAPFYTDTDGTHPVSGNRAFGIKQNSDGSYTLYTRGVDRVRFRSLEFLADHVLGGAFSGADDLWTAFQDDLAHWIEDHGGTSNKIVVPPKRVDWEAVHDDLMGN